jgi:hypothetical protein
VNLVIAPNLLLYMEEDESDSGSYESASEGEVALQGGAQLPPLTYEERRRLDREQGTARRAAVWLHALQAPVQAGSPFVENTFGAGENECMCCNPYFRPEPAGDGSLLLAPQFVRMPVPSPY